MAILKCQVSGLCYQHDFWLLQEKKHLNWVDEETAAACLMARWISFVPGTGALCMAQRHEQLHNARLGKTSRQYNI